MPFSWIDGTRARLRLLFARRAAESRMNEEFRFHIDMETERRIRETGLDPEEARRQTLAAFGGVENHKEALRSDRGLAWLTGLSLDLKLGLRMLAKSPGLTIVGVLGMAVAVAIGTVSFGVIYSFIGTRLPLDDGDRVVVIQNFDARRNIEYDGTHLHDLADWREALRAVEELGAYRVVGRNVISRDARPDPMRIAEMTASGFRIARVPPLLGRYLHDEDERLGAPPVVVIGYDVWQNRFAGDSAIVGRTLQLGATTHTIVGVMPQGFAFPFNNRVWTPLRLEPSRFERGDAPPIQVFGRLAPRASVSDAQAQAATIGTRLAAVHPASHQHVRPLVRPYASSFFQDPELTWALHVIQILVSMILVVIGTNVATLVYARTASRAGEIAVRTALGASRRRIVAQLFTEALVLSSAAAALGLVGGSVGLWYIRSYARRFAGEQVPFWMDFGLSPGMLLYVAVLAVLGALIVGVFPALKATGRRVQTNLQQLSMGSSGYRLGKSWTVLIVAQVAVAVALLPVVLYAAVVQRRDSTDGPRYPTTEWVTASLDLDRETVASASAKDDGTFMSRYMPLEAELVRRLKSEPGISDVVLTSSVPGGERSIQIEVADARGAPRPDTATREASAGNSTGLARVDLEFFRAFGVPVLAGRGFQPGDVSAQATAVIVNRSFVRRILAGGDPLGRRVRQPAAPARDGGPEIAPAGPWYEIVGVVPDFPTPEGATGLRPRMYRPLLPQAGPPLTLAVRVKGAAPISIAARLREIAVAVDPMLRLADIRPLDETLSISGMADRVIFAATGFVMLSVLLLSAAGIYALMSFTVARRRREIGIRAALGAGSRHVIASVLSQAARQIAIGIAIGIALAGLVVQAMEGGMADTRGAFILVAVVAFMTIVGLAAALGPARRALRIQPTEALRSD